MTLKKTGLIFVASFALGLWISDIFACDKIDYQEWKEMSNTRKAAYLDQVKKDFKEAERYAQMTAPIYAYGQTLPYDAEKFSRHVKEKESCAKELARVQRLYDDENSNNNNSNSNNSSSNNSYNNRTQHCLSFNNCVYQ